MRTTKFYKLQFRKMRHLRKKGDIDGALSILRQLVVQQPEHPAAYLVIGHILWEAGQLPQASKQFRITCRHFPRSKVASLGLFHTLWRQSKRNAALDEIKRFLTISYSKDHEDVIEEMLGRGLTIGSTRTAASHRAS